MNLGESIRSIRKKKKILQKTVADKVGVTQAYICQIEKGLRDPSLIVLNRILKELDCKLAIMEDDHES